MPHSSKKLVPIGCNMNDAAYPFRGEHRLASCINHGHSGVVKRVPTSLGMRISGSNLVIENVQTSKGTELECELGVDGGIPRPVALQPASAFMVPGDGHDYNLIAAVRVSGATARHYCRLTLNGSEGASVLRVRAPENCAPDTVYIVADGRRLRPTAGWFRVPIQTKECALVANVSLGGGDQPSPPPPHVCFAAQPRSRSPSQQQQQRRPSSSDAARSPLRGGGGERRRSSPPPPPPPENLHFFLETVPAPAGPPEQAALLTCRATGQVIALTPHGTVAVPYAGGPFQLQLPPAGLGDGAGPARTAVPPAVADVPDLETRIQPPLTPSASVGSPGDASDTSAGAAAAAASMPSFVATAPNFSLQLTGEAGSTVFGVGVASLPLLHRRAQSVQIVVSDAHGRVVLRQRSHVPALESAAAGLQLVDDGRGGLAVTARPGSRLSIGGVPQPDPSAAAALPRIVPQQVALEQPNADGTFSRATLDVAPRSAAAAGVLVPGVGSPTAVPVPVAGAPAATASQPEAWVRELCDALQKPHVEEQRRLVQNIRPASIPGSTIVSFVRDQLTRAPPAISFTVSKAGLEAVQCPGCSITAAVGNDPARQIPAFGSVALVPGKPALLTASMPSSQRPVSACRVQMSMAMAATPTSGAAVPYSPAQTDGKADTELVNRLVDCLLRHNANATPVANDLSAMSTATFSAQGRRLLPLLTSCLRNASASGAAAAATQVANTQVAAAAAAAAAATPEEIFFTCGPGYVDNVYTSHPQYHLFGAVDDQAPSVLQQRGRVPASGVLEGERRPFFVRLTARDPATGAVKAERTITVLGIRPTAPSPSPPPPLPPATESTNVSAPMTAASAPAPDAAAGATLPPPEQTPLPAMPYVDVSLQTVGQDVQARLVCAPHLRLVCDVDGVGGSTGRSDFVAKMLATRPHHVNLSLVDAYGRVVFQQKLAVPAMTSPLWGLAVQHNGLSVDPETGSLATASIDRAPERTLQGNFVSFDASVPHFVHLRKYINGIHGSCAGEVSLRLPGLTLPPELEEVTRILRRRAGGQMSDPQAKAELQQLRARCSAPAVVELITSILDGWPAFAGVAVQTGGRDSPSSRVFFRLTGTD
ncbi:hypothetical protein NESM_000167300 [Novymonas esmeraldas]|uniref:Uncharacterized protein n=1 Tax=Novymonas esmeraldas TaxID=1808958 RepID=A0AAW0F7N1_9TRYP